MLLPSKFDFLVLVATLNQVQCHTLIHLIYLFVALNDVGVDYSYMIQYLQPFNLHFFTIFMGFFNVGVLSFLGSLEAKKHSKTSNDQICKGVVNTQMGVTKACWKSSPIGEPKIDLSNKKFKEIEGKMCAKCTYLEFLVLPKNQINEN